MDKIPATSTSRYLALIAGFTALYLVYGYASGVALGHTIFELDVFFLISALFTILVSLTGRKWSATILGLISGLLLSGDPNAPFLIGLSLVPNGLVFDLTIRGRTYPSNELSTKRLVIAGALGNLAMAVAGLLISAYDKALPTSGILFVVSVAVALVGNPIIGVLGAFFGKLVVERVEGRAKSPLIR